MKVEIKENADTKETFVEIRCKIVNRDILKLERQIRLFSKTLFAWFTIVWLLFYTVFKEQGIELTTLPLGSWEKMLLPSALVSAARTEWGISV